MTEVARLNIRKITEQDFDSVWEIFHSVVAAGITYPYEPTTSKEQAYVMWMPSLNEKRSTYVALLKDEIVGTYYIKPNLPGLGSHVANAGYMVHPDKCGLGIGRAIGEHSLVEAKKLGYKAMQFNAVVSTNIASITLWEKLGFKRIGVVPAAFNHQEKGLVDTYIMHRFLE
ncbi:MAG: GNAT family N-acetyltransferase [Gammaproteobacteria bacterium]|nr:GNAT family N-acetyltransferase [Gammaproteobacteria bacterium]